MLARTAGTIALVLTVSACNTAVETHPPRTATEELLISAAADRAADRLELHLSKGDKVFLDATNFEGYDSKYAIGAIRDRILKEGALLVDSKASADTIVEIRAGALSTDEHDTLIGIPSFNIPIPFAGNLPFPKIALYEDHVEEGVAKFAATSYGTKNGSLEVSEDPQYGFSEDAKRTVLLFFSWTTNNAEPDDAATASDAQPDAPDRPRPAPAP